MTRAVWIAATMLLQSLAGCGEVTEGGSVEFSWRLRDSRGGTFQIQCNDTAVDRIQLDWDVNGVLGSDSWECDNNHGSTRFEVPEGQVLLTVSPRCVEGPADPRSYIAPAPLARTVTRGQVVELGAVVLVLQLDRCGNGPGEQLCTCQ